MHKLQNMKFKIKDEEHSRRIQECLFRLGYQWRHGSTNVEFTESAYIYCYEDYNITCGNLDITYYDHENTEQTVDYLQQEVDKLKNPSLESLVIVPAEHPTTNPQCVTYGQLINQANKANMSVHFYPDGEIQLWDADTETDKSFRALDSAMYLVEAKLNWLGVLNNGGE